MAPLSTQPDSRYSVSTSSSVSFSPMVVSTCRMSPSEIRPLPSAEKEPKNQAMFNENMNEWCFRWWFYTVRLYWVRANEMNLGINHSPGAELMAWPVLPDSGRYMSPSEIRPFPSAEKEQNNQAMFNDYMNEWFFRWWFYTVRPLHKKNQIIWQCSMNISMNGSFSDDSTLQASYPLQKKNQIIRQSSMKKWMTMLQVMTPHTNFRSII